MKQLRDNRENTLRGLANRLTIVRSGAGYTQAAFARSIGLSPRAYHSYEKGTRSMPADALIELAKNYEINLHWLLTGVGAGNPIDHCAQTGQFAAEVRTYLDAEKIKIGSKNFGNIITKWGTTLAGGKAATMPEVYIWVDLLKE